VKLVIQGGHYDPVALVSGYVYVPCAGKNLCLTAFDGDLI